MLCSLSNSWSNSHLSFNILLYYSIFLWFYFVRMQIWTGSIFQLSFSFGFYGVWKLVIIWSPRYNSLRSHLQPSLCYHILRPAVHCLHLLFLVLVFPFLIHYLMVYTPRACRFLLHFLLSFLCWGRTVDFFLLFSYQQESIHH